MKSIAAVRALARSASHSRCRLRSPLRQAAAGSADGQGRPAEDQRQEHRHGLCPAGRDAGAYKRVKLDPVKVAFSPSWNPDRTGSSIKLSTQEKETSAAASPSWSRRSSRARCRRAAAIRSTEIRAGRAAGAGRHRQSLHQRARHRHGRSRTIVRSAGEMTLIAELTDSASGQVLARVADRREATDTGCRSPTAWSTSRRRAGSPPPGRRRLRKALDNAQGIGAK
jgi:hypothetical protein